LETSNGEREEDGKQVGKLTKMHVLETSNGKREEDGKQVGKLTKIHD